MPANPVYKQLEVAHRQINLALKVTQLFHDIQQQGLEQSSFLAVVQEMAAAETVTLSHPLRNEGDSSVVAVLQWNGGTMETQEVTLNAELYNALCSEPAVIGNLMDELSHQELEAGRSLWGASARSLLIAPLQLHGQTVGCLHLANSGLQGLAEADLGGLQLLTDGLAPLVAFYALQAASVEAEEQQAALANVQADSQRESDELRGEVEALAKKLAASQQERNRLNHELQRYRQEREQLRAISEGFESETNKILDQAEEMRQFVLHLHNSANQTQSVVESLQDQQLAMQKEHAELVMDAASEMLPQARNLSNHLDNLQDPAFGQLHSRQLKFVRASHRSGAYINRLLAQLNDYSRCMTGQIFLNPETMDLPTLINEVHGQYLSHIHNKKQNFQFNSASVNYTGDNYATRQMLTALMEHAVDATPAEGSIVLNLSGGNGSIQLDMVHDTLPVSEEDMANIFVPFQRPDFDPDDDIPPGLSLALVQQFARVQQGHVSVVLKDGQLHFSLRLPAVVSEEVPQTLEGDVEVQPLPEIPAMFLKPLRDSVSLPKLPPYHPSADNIPAPAVLDGNVFAMDEDEEILQSLDSLDEIEEVEAIELTDDDVLEVPAVPKPPPMPPAPFGGSSLKDLASRSGLSAPPMPPAPVTPDSHTSMQSLPSLPSLPPVPQKPSPMAPPSPLSSASHSELPPPPAPISNVPLLLEEEPEEVDAELILEEEEAPALTTSERDPSTLTKKSFLPSEIEPPTLLCLAADDDEPQDMIFEDLERAGFQLALAPLEPTILDGITEDQRPTVLMLYSNSPEMSYDPIIQHMQSQPGTGTMPILTTTPTVLGEKLFQLYWNGFISQPQPEKFWRIWFTQLAGNHDGNEYNLLSIGLHPDALPLHPLMLFASGPRYHYSAETNPAQGIQMLWEHPPEMLMIQFDAGKVDQWLPMFDELSRSGRTINIPLMIFSEYPITEEVNEALTPLNFLYFQPYA
ncbi:MAG: hypothetical protein EP343_28220 [Deltaproteobacteria bacterium]|nr:MAG: hypothetical protein EP343_28220 [Deltaproteobacteria bacterium]